MRTKVSRRRKTCKKRRIEPQERRQHQNTLQERIDEAVAENSRQIVQAGLREQVTECLGRAKGQRRESEDQTEVEGSCNRCDTHCRARFYRAGYYKRRLLSFETYITIAVPRVSCICGGMVDFEFLDLVPYGRTWFNIEERARELAGICVSLRDGVEVLAWGSKQPLSIATVNKMVTTTARLAEAFHAGPLERVPAVVMLDGVWLKLLCPTGEEYTDKRGRRRQRVKKKKFPLLVAYGVDPVSGERWLLDWERGKDEDEASWRKLLERLLQRGLDGERGLELVVHDGSKGLEKALDVVYLGDGVEHQRCIFHKLLNVRRDVVGEETMAPNGLRERRKEMVAEAARVYDGESEAEVRQALQGFCAKWREKEPGAVATLERGFERTIVYLKVQERARCRGQQYRRECMRTTSPLERV
ncbi:MAG: transposase, partial [Planctomycetota bacterium]